MTQHSDHIESKKMISAMIADVGDGYIQMGKDLLQRQNYLRAVVTAWNIACLPKYKQESAIVRLIKHFQKINPDSTFENTKNFADDIRQLISKKIELYPKIKLQVLDCTIHEVNGKDHITVIFDNQNGLPDKQVHKIPNI